MDICELLSRTQDANSFLFRVDGLALDVRGSRRRPGEMLMVDSNGFLTVRGELPEDSSSNYAREMRRLIELIRQLRGP